MHRDMPGPLRDAVRLMHCGKGEGDLVIANHAPARWEGKLHGAKSLERVSIFHAVPSSHVGSKET